MAKGQRFLVSLSCAALLAGCESGYSQASRLEQGARVWQGWALFFLAIAVLAGLWGVVAWAINGLLGNADRKAAESAQIALAGLEPDLKTAAADVVRRQQELVGAQSGMSYFERIAEALEKDAQ